MEGLEDQLVWPDVAQRARLAMIYRQILRGMIGVMDVTEYLIKKPKNKIKERKTWSGKKRQIFGGIYLSWTTLAGLFMYMSDWLRMTGKFSHVLRSTYNKVFGSAMEN